MVLPCSLPARVHPSATNISSVSCRRKRLAFPPNLCPAAPQPKHLPGCIKREVRPLTQMAVNACCPGWRAEGRQPGCEIHLFLEAGALSTRALGRERCRPKLGIYRDCFFTGGIGDRVYQQLKSWTSAVWGHTFLGSTPHECSSA